MKWRHSIIYLVLLLLVGGYFYYFEIVRKEQKAATDREAKRVFHLNPEKADSVEILPREGKPVRLIKEDRWILVEPVRTDVDASAVDGLLGAFSRLQVEREIVAAPEDLKPYGLETPVLRIRVREGDNRHELLLGDRNPVGDARYARSEAKTSVFLVAEGNWAVFNKGLNDLRRRSLFTFAVDDVRGLRTEWEDGSVVQVRLLDDGKTWQADGQGDVKIRPGKVENVIQQLHWLRAIAFVDEDPSKLAPHGLDPPHVKVDLRLSGGESIEFRLGRVEDGKKDVTAVSSQLHAVVKVNSGVLEDIPKTISAIEERSLFPLDRDDVEEVAWKLDNVEGQAVRLEPNKWGMKGKDGKPREFKDSWRVNSLLWDLGDAEYREKADSGGPVAEEPHGRMDFFIGGKIALSLAWDKPAPEGEAAVHLWMTGSREAGRVRVASDVIRKIEQNIRNVIEATEKNQAGS